jgi:hypothetical protein
MQRAHNKPAFFSHFPPFSLGGANEQDSSEGLARMYADLDPLARHVRSAACTLLMFSFFFCGTLEGLFGLLAASCVLCCAAPGSLGVAHSSRCAKICAIFTATLALFHLLAISTFSIAVLPTMPVAVAQQCSAHEREMELSAHPAGKMPPPEKFGLSEVFLTGKVFAEGVPMTADQPMPSPMKKMDLDAAPPLLDDDSYSTAAAKLVAGGSIRAARHLEQVVAVVTRASFEPAPLSAHCAKVARFYAEFAPVALLMAGLIEFCLFLSAMTLARRAAHLILAARSMGANGI